jgi:hypothetical protein
MFVSTISHVLLQGGSIRWIYYFHNKEIAVCSGEFACNRPNILRAFLVSTDGQSIAAMSDPFSSTHGSGIRTASVVLRTALVHYSVHHNDLTGVPYTQCSKKLRASRALMAEPIASSRVSWARALALRVRSLTLQDSFCRHLKEVLDLFLVRNWSKIAALPPGAPASTWWSSSNPMSISSSP